MDLSALIKGVQDFWNFIWPPVVLLIVLAALALAIAPGALAGIRDVVRAHLPDHATRLAAARNFRHFGFDKLTPVVGVFCLIFLLYVARNAVDAVGGALPLTVVEYPGVWLLLMHPM